MEGGEGLSDAEKLRQRRRQKILANQGSRLDRILGASGASIKSTELRKDSSSSSPDEESDGVLKGWNIVSGSEETMEETEEAGVTFIRKRKDTTGEGSSKPVGAKESAEGSLTASVVGASKKDDDVAEPTPSPREEIKREFKSPRGFQEPLPDGSTIHPKLPFWFCRVCVCLLGVMLSLFSDKYLFVTFFSWELAVLGINGLPENEAPSSVLVLLLALMGLKEKNLQRLKTAFKLGNCVVTDLSLFVVCVLMTRLIF